MTGSFNTRPAASDLIEETGISEHGARPDEGSTTSRIGRNTAINLAGALFPLLLSLATVPAYLRLIGEVRYGVLAIIWVILGYFGVFDLGLSRATANQIARMRNESPVAREGVFWTALIVNAAVGVAGGVILFFVGHLLIGHVLNVSAELRSEAVAALPWLAIAVPLTTLTLVLAGALEGRERFLSMNLLAIAALAMFQLGPLAYAYWVGPALQGLIMSATLALLVSTALSLIVTGVLLPVRSRPRIDRSRLSALLRYGGWIAVTGLVGPLLTVLDRVLIGSVLGARAVTRYAIPFALVARAQILSSSLARTIFPRFSMLESTDAADVSRESLRALVAVMTLLTVAGAVALEPFLRVWVGDDIASSSAPVGEILLFGVWLNSIAVVPFAFLQAQGRPDLPAKFHLIELTPYVLGLVLALHVAGIKGAAAAWSARALVDAILLFWAARNVSRPAASANLRDLAYGGTFVAIACLASLTLFDDPMLRVAFGLALLATSFGWAWHLVSSRVLSLIRHRRG